MVDSHEAHNINSNSSASLNVLLNDQQHFRLNKSNGIKLETNWIARSKLISIKSKISEAVINNKISHEDFMTIINEDKKHKRLKKSIRMMNSQRSDTEKNNLIKEGKKVGINEVIKRNEIINNSLKP